ncbi:MAG: hypothetical protein ACE5LU_08465 [Anaerolineae bacterium]
MAFADMIHVVWAETVYGRPEIYHTYKDGDTDWSVSERLEAGTQPDLGVGLDGTVDLVWLDDYELGGSFRASFIRYRRWNPTLRMWSDAANVAVGSRGTLRSPAVAVAPEGTSHVVWVDLVSGSPRLRYRGRSESGWSYPENVASGTAPDIGVDTDGIIHIVWADSSLLGDTNDIYYRWRNPQDGWSLAYVLSDRQSVDSVDPTISIDQDGTVHVGWRELAGGSSAMLYRSGLKSSWPSRSEQATPLMSRGDAPVIAVDERRFVYLAFAGPNGIQHRMREPTMRAWQAGEPIAVDQPAATSPDLVAVGEDTVHVVWTQPGVAGQTDVFYRAMGPGLEPTQTPTFTATTIATTTLTLSLTPTATSQVSSTPMPTSIATWTSTVTPTPTVTGTPGRTLTASPTPLPAATWTPSPAPTKRLQRKGYLPLILRNFSRAQRDRTTYSLPIGYRVGLAFQRLPNSTCLSHLQRFLPLCLYWSRM